MSESSGSPGRYQRTPNGLVGAMIVTVLVVLAFVAWRAINRDDLEIKPEPVDYLGAVREIQSTGVDVVYPAQLPADWICTSANYAPGRSPEWDLGTLTPDDDFVGLQLRDESIEDLVETYVDAEATEGDAATVRTDVGSTWRTFTDDGGDFALAAEVGDRSLLVYGSAPRAQVETFAATLTDAPAAG